MAVPSTVTADGRVFGALLWDPRTQGVLVVAHDATSDETVTIYVEPDQALEVFRHPFAYAGQPTSRDGLQVKTR